MNKISAISGPFLALIMLTLNYGEAFSQDKPVTQKIKSMEVVEEKYENEIAKKNIEYKVEYDSRGNILNETEYNNGEFVSHFSYEYDADNNKVKETEYDKTGKLKKVSKYKYENNLRKEKLVYDDKGRLKTKKIYTYTTF